MGRNVLQGHDEGLLFFWVRMVLFIGNGSDAFEQIMPNLPFGVKGDTSSARPTSETGMPVRGRPGHGQQGNDGGPSVWNRQAEFTIDEGAT